MSGQRRCRIINIRKHRHLKRHRNYLCFVVQLSPEKVKLQEGSKCCMKSSSPRPLSKGPDSPSARKRVSGKFNPSPVRPTTPCRLVKALSRSDRAGSRAAALRSRQRRETCTQRQAQGPGRHREGRGGRPPTDGGRGLGQTLLPSRPQKDQPGGLSTANPRRRDVSIPLWGGFGAAAPANRLV